MPEVLVQESTLQSIAAAIREKNKKVDKYLPSAMPAAIRALGGAAELDVISSVSLPAGVTEGQVVIITSVTPGTVYVGTDEPTAPTANDAWIVVDQASIGAQLSPTMRLGLTKVRQYNGTMWTAREGYIGSNGSWVQFAASFPSPGTPLEQWTWREIIALCNSGDDVTAYFEVGDQKKMLLNGTEEISVAVGAFNHNTIAGTNDQKAAISFTFVTLPKTGYAMNTSNVNSGGWNGSGMRTTHMPALLKQFPAELQADNAIKTVKVNAGKGGASAALIESEDKLRLHSVTELGLTISNAAVEGTAYPYYSAGNRVKKLSTGAGTYYYTRTAATNTGVNFWAITPTGSTESSNATPARGVCCAFDI